MECSHISFWPVMYLESLPSYVCNLLSCCHHIALRVSSVILVDCTGIPSLSKCTSPRLVRREHTR